MSVVFDKPGEVLMLPCPDCGHAVSWPEDRCETCQGTGSVRARWRVGDIVTLTLTSREHAVGVVTALDGEGNPSVRCDNLRGQKGERYTNTFTPHKDSVRLPKYVITCGAGHEAKTHQGGYCTVCWEEGTPNKAWYLFEDGSIQQIDPMFPSGECACDKPIFDQADYMCEECRAKA